MKGVRAKLTTKFLGVAAAAAIAIGLAAAPNAQGQQQQQVLVIQGGTLIDGNGGAPVQNSVIVITGNRITAVGRAGAVPVPAGATVINAAGKFITPGLIDAMSFHTWFFNEAYLYFGITSVVPNVGRGDQGVAERDAINHGMFEGPRHYIPIQSFNGAALKTPEEARARAKQLIAQGADVIGAQDGNAPAEVFAAYADEAHKAGKAAVFRCVGPTTRAKSCVLAGADVMLHTGLIGVEMNKNEEKWKSYVGLPPDVYCDMDPAKEKEMVAFLASHQAAVVPNLQAADHGFPSTWQKIRQEDRELFTNTDLLSYYPQYAIADLMDNNKMPEEELTPAQISIRSCGYKNHAKFIGDLIAAGGHALPSMDDSQSAPGLGVLQEMEIFQEDAKVPAMKVLQQATKFAAQHFHLNDIGTVEVGKFADLDILDADPSADIRNMRKISMVIKDGHVVDRGFHPWYRGAMFANDKISYDGAPVSNMAFTNAVKQFVAKPVQMPKPYMTVTAPNGQESGVFPGIAYVRKGPGLGAIPDYVISPTPAIEAIAPRTILQNTAQTTVTLTGVNFVKRSVVYVNGEPVTTMVEGATKLRFVVPSEKFINAGKLHVQVKNPEPVESPEWGSKSNTAHILVPYAFSTSLARAAGPATAEN